MNPYNYNSKIIELIKYTSTNPNDVYDYSDTPLEKTFNRLFQYYQKELIAHSHFDISPSIVYFNNNISVNAKACKDTKADYYVISINKGTILKLQTLFESNNKLLIGTNGLDYFINFENKLKTPIHILMFVVTSQFTFYHELAHLIQKSEYIQNGLNEQIEFSTEESLRRHILEMDADLFSAVTLSGEIYQSISKLFKEKVTAEDLENILSIFASAIFIYLLSFNTSQKQMYFRSNSHPHPIMRYYYIIQGMIDYFINELKIRMPLIIINSGNVFKRSFYLSEKLSKVLFKDSPYNYFEEYYKKNEVEIIKYYYVLVNELKLDNSLSLNKRNNWVESRKGNS